MADYTKALKPRKRPGRQARKAKPPKGFENLKKHLDKLSKDFKDATKKLTVHQEPRSKMAASLRSLMDQPRKKVPKSPHKDKKNERKINPKYKNIFKKKT